MDRKLNRLLLTSVLVTLTLTGIAPLLYAQYAGTSHHEPIFGIGPRTIWRNGWGIEVGVERDRAEQQDTWGLEYEVLYGITVNTAVTVTLQQPLQEGRPHFTLRGKYRFFRRDIPGGVYHAAILGGWKQARGQTAYFAGLSGAYEGRRWLWFLTGRYRLQPGRLPESVIQYDIALGLRPVRTSYYQPDLVAMVELNGQYFRTSPKGLNPSGHRMLLGIGVWLTYRNWAFKPGMQLPLYRSSALEPLSTRWVGSVEVHF